jgi:hypothetical protein
MPLEDSFIHDYRMSCTAFVETGTFHGNSVALAVKCGFTSIYSIEFDEALYTRAVEKFKNKSRVSLVHGDSAIELPKLIKGINEQIFFWLDAHCGNAQSPLPLMQELAAIKEHPIKNHTILIDDARLFSRDLIVKKDDIVKALREINPKYIIRLEDDSVARDDVLIAYIPED